MDYKLEEFCKWPELEIGKSKPLSLCVVQSTWPKENPFQQGDVVIYLGEIPQMPGHVVFATKKGQVLFGYHEDNFRVIPDDDA